MHVSTSDIVGGLSMIGRSRLVLTVGDEPIEVFVYRPPARVATAGMLVVFPGMHRDAAGLREKAVPLADRLGLTVVAPHLDRSRFPRWRYHHAGVARQDRILPSRYWTATLVQDLIAQIRTRLDHGDVKVHLFGHSAGGQLLSRMCAYTPLAEVANLVIANPSSYVLPLRGEAAPYGFGGLYDDARWPERIAGYLATPVTICLGSDDTEDHHLSRSPAAMRQGANRLERGRFAFRTGRAVAAHYGFDFGWKLIEIPETGHSSRGVLSSAALSELLSH
jgi:alpha-beta hydrolase superfamily lysophospholipase